jgi:OPA family sugar phosphate sensor protein UhpC-like MFS transporter
VATPLTVEHRSWRTKVFVATWLSYVGFYFCRTPFSATKADIGAEAGFSATTLGDIGAVYLIAYAIGQFLASAMGPKLGPRKNVLIGMAASVGVTLLMGVSLNVPLLMGLVFVNGLAQATGWSGNVGTMAAWFHKHERGRVMGWWSTNFSVGALASQYAMAGVLALAAANGGDWRWCFYAGALVLAVVWVQFYFFQRNKPEDVGLSPIDDPVTPTDEATTPEPEPTNGLLGLSRDAWINILLVGGFYFFIKLIRYAVWGWSVYFLVNNFGLTSTRANVYGTLFTLAGIPGVIVTGYISDRYLQSRRAGISTAMLCALIVATGLLILFGDTSVVTFTILLGAVGFTMFGPDALLSGAGAMDIGGRRAATRATGIICGFGALGPIVQELAIGRLTDASSGDPTPAFIMMFGSAVLSTLFCVALVIRNRRGGKGI